MPKNSKHFPSDIFLAPMEGIVDARFRKIYARIGGIDRFVTEFIRVTNQRLSKQTILKTYPEITNQGLTDNQIPVYCQLLGENANFLAENAFHLVEFGAYGIDLNFGCPAKTVNNHGGGAKLLKSPETIYNIIKAVRSAVPSHKPVTAKMRLGFNDKSLAIENAQAAELAGADQLIVHARTKLEGYRPPAHWQYIHKMKNATKIDIIANGEMWNHSDISRCIKTTDCKKIMLGRGLIANPTLALQAKRINHSIPTFTDILLLLLHFLTLLSFDCPARYQCNLIKQWLVYLKEYFGEAHPFFNQIKRINDPSALQKALINTYINKTTRGLSHGQIGGLDLTPIADKIKSNHHKFVKSL